MSEIIIKPEPFEFVEFHSNDEEIEIKVEALDDNETFPNEGINNAITETGSSSFEEDDDKTLVKKVIKFPKNGGDNINKIENAADEGSPSSSEDPDNEYDHLISMALHSFPDKIATTAEICDWIRGNFPLYAAMRNDILTDIIDHKFKDNPRFIKTTKIYNDDGIDYQTIAWTFPKRINSNPATIIPMPPKNQCGL